MRGMRYYYAIPIFLLAFILQTTVMWRLPILGYSPNLLLCMVIVFSFIYDVRYGLVLGVVFGLVLDIFTSQYLSINAISFVVVFLIVRLFRGIFNHESFILDMAMAIIATPVHVMIVWSINRIMGVPVDVIFALRSILPLIVTNFFLVGILHFIFVRTVIKFKQDMKFTGEL